MWLFPEAAGPRLVDAIVGAEALGLDELWLGDEGPAREPFAVLAAAAQATSRIRLCVGITNPYVRHPALSVTTALTIHELSGGRFVLGVGSGGQMSLGPFNLAAEEPLARVDRFLDTARAVCARVPGPDYDPPDIAISSSSVAAPMPLYVGGRGPKINRLASEKADGAFVAGLPPFRYDEVVGWTREVNPIELALYPSVAFNEAAVAKHRPEMVWLLLDAPAHVREELGVDTHQLRKAANSLRLGDPGPATALVTDEMLPQLMLVDGPTMVGRRLAALVEHHRPTSIGLAVLQADLESGITDAAAAFESMRLALDGGTP